MRALSFRVRRHTPRTVEQIQAALRRRIDARRERLRFAAALAAGAALGLAFGAACTVLIGSDITTFRREQW